MTLIFGDRKFGMMFRTPAIFVIDFFLKELFGVIEHRDNELDASPHPTITKIANAHHSCQQRKCQQDSYHMSRPKAKSIISPFEPTESPKH
jgi:hypothetical protein